MVKTCERGDVVVVTRQVVFGDAERLAALLTIWATSATIHTRVVEREHLAVRQHHRRLTHKTKAFSKKLGTHKPATHR